MLPHVPTDPADSAVWGEEGGCEGGDDANTSTPAQPWQDADKTFKPDAEGVEQKKTSKKFCRQSYTKFPHQNSSDQTPKQRLLTRGRKTPGNQTTSCIISSYSKEKAFKCTLCDYSACLQTSLFEHIKKKHSKEKAYKCFSCDYLASSYTNLKRHMVKKHTNMSFQCPSCQNTYSFKSDLDRHMLVHTGERPYKCSSCDYTTTQKSFLKIHFQSKHTKNKTLKCSKCNYTTVFNGHMKRHVQSHPKK